MNPKGQTKFAPETLAKWRKRKIEVDGYVKRGEISAEEGLDLMRLFVSRMMAEQCEPQTRHLRAVK